MPWRVEYENGLALTTLDATFCVIALADVNGKVKKFTYPSDFMEYCNAAEVAAEGIPIL